MSFKEREPEGGEVEDRVLALFARASSWGAPAAARRVKQILGKRLKPGIKVLDIGTGPGTILLSLKKRCPGPIYMGLDISFGMLQRARHHAQQKNTDLIFFAGDGEDLPFGSKTLDTIISFFAMHHMDHPEKLLQEINRVLKPGGKLLIIDFKRDMPGWLYLLINMFWQTVFLFTKGRTGFRDSARSAWNASEIREILEKNHMARFQVRTNQLELWITDRQ